MKLIDSHCHLTDLSEEELSAVIERAAQNHVLEMVCIGAGDGEGAAWRAVEIARSRPNIWASVGIHPCDAAVRQDLDIYEELLADPKVVAIGETGLDFFRDRAPVEMQRALFERSIEVARNLKKPLIIHCRDAQDETLEMMERFHAHEAGGVFHCYTGDAELAKRLEGMNFYVSFPGTVTFKNAHALREVVRNISLEWILLETDSPYMAPEPFRGKPSEPAHVLYVAQKVAEVHEVSVERVAQITSANSTKLFGLSS